MGRIFLYDTQIGEKLRFYRQKRGLTQRALAKKMGISAQQLQKYEAGRNRISASRVKVIAEILNVPAHYFLSDTKAKTHILNDISREEGANQLVYYYSMIKSEKIRKLLLHNTAVYVDSGL